MSDTNLQIEEQLDKLATICCSLLEGDTSASTIEDATVESLLKSLLMSGYARKGDTTLQVDIEDRVKDKCREPAMHRGGALSSLTGKLQTKFDELKRWDSQQPDENRKPKAANISSPTEA